MCCASGSVGFSLLTVDTSFCSTSELTHLNTDLKMQHSKKGGKLRDKIYPCVIIQILVHRSSGKPEMSDVCLLHMALMNIIIFIFCYKRRWGSKHLLCWGTNMPDAFQWRNRCPKSVSLTCTCVTSHIWASIVYCLSHDNWPPCGRLFDLCYSDRDGANLIYFPSLFQEWDLPYFILFLSTFKSVEKNDTSFNVPVSQREEVYRLLVSLYIYFFP